MIGAAIGFVFWIVVVATISFIFVIKKLVYVCPPHKVFVFSGRGRAGGERPVGYRLVRGGRTVRIPILEVVDEIDLNVMTIDLSVPNAYTKGGIPLTVQGVANVKVPGDAPLIHNALERFLGYSQAQIKEVAKQTLEGNLRGVIATLTPEQVNQDVQAFSERLTEEADHDLQKLGLVLDTLKIQNVSDEVGYLAAVGRIRSAKVRMHAAIAEANAQAEAAEIKWQNVMQAEAAKLDAQVQVAHKENDRRIADARTRREALIAEQRAEVQAAIAQSQAEMSLQDARIEQVKLQLQAEIVQPAEAQRRQAEELAKGAAARIIEQGHATANVLSRLAKQYQSNTAAGRDVLLMQKLLPIIDKVAEPLATLQVNRLTVLGAGTQGSDGKSLAASLLGANEQVKAVTGIDLTQTLRDKLG